MWNSFFEIHKFRYCCNAIFSSFVNITNFDERDSTLIDLINEEQVLKWLIEQKTTATIEEVTDEILKTLINEHEYVLVYFSQ